MKNRKWWFIVLVPLALIEINSRASSLVTAATFSGTGYPTMACNAGNAFQQTDAPVGQQLWTCIVPNVWQNPTTFALSSGSTMSYINKSIVYDMVTPGSGTSVTDLSGNGNAGTFNGNMSCGSPAWTAGVGITFNGATGCIGLPLAPMTASKGTLLCYAHGGSVAGKALIGGDSAATLWLNFTGAIVGYSESSYYLLATKTPQGPVCHAEVFGSPVHEYYNGTEVTYATRSNIPNAGTPTHVELGSYAGSGNHYLGVQYYFVNYSATPTAAQSQLDTAIISAQLHNSRSISIGDTESGPFVVFGIDSITANFLGCCIDTPFIGDLPGFALQNNGIPGATEDYYSALIAGAYPAASWKVYGLPWTFIDFGGTNDLAVPTSPAAILGYKETTCSSVHANGGRCIWVSTIARNGISDSNRQILNEDERTVWTSYADGFIDAGSDCFFGNVSIYAANSGMTPDGVHPTSSAYTRMNWIYQAELRRVLGFPTHQQRLANVCSIGLTTSVGSTNLLTNPVAGQYVLRGSLATTTAATSGTGCSVTVTFSWTDPSGPQTSTSAAISLTALSGYVNLPTALHGSTNQITVASGNVAYSTTLAAGTCSGEQYALSVWADQLGPN